MGALFIIKQQSHKEINIFLLKGPCYCQYMLCEFVITMWQQYILGIMDVNSLITIIMIIVGAVVTRASSLNGHLYQWGAHIYDGWCIVEESEV